MGNNSTNMTIPMWGQTAGIYQLVQKFTFCQTKNKNKRKTKKTSYKNYPGNKHSDLVGNMESLTPIINELHDILTIIKEGSGSYNISNELSLDLPEIAVVGSQSVGKSSLLEYIIG